MKRYKPTLTAGITNEFPNGWVPYMAEQDDGEWVKWEDVKEYIESFKTCEISSVGCNCEDKYNELKALEYAGTIPRPKHWICPSHGYKKL